MVRIPFESEHKFMATVHQEAERDGFVMHVKGAPDRLIKACATQVTENDHRALHWG